MSFWLFVPYTSISPPPAALQMLIAYPEFFTLYMQSGVVFLEVSALLTVSFSIDFSQGIWQNVAFTWNSNTQTLAVYINGVATASTFVMFSPGKSKRV